MARVGGIAGIFRDKLNRARENDDGITVNINVTDEPGSEVAAVADVVSDEAEQDFTEAASASADEVATESENSWRRLKQLQRSSVGVTPGHAVSEMTHLAYLGKQWNVDMPTRSTLSPVCESSAWTNASALPGNFTVAVEFAGELVKRGWEWLKKLVSEWIEKVKVFWNNYASSASRMQREAEALIKRAAGMQFGKQENKMITDAGLAKKLDMGSSPKIVTTSLVTSVKSLGAQVEAVKSSYLTAMGDTNLEAVMGFLDGSKDVKADATAETTDPNDYSKTIAAVPSGAEQASAAFNKWVLDLVTGLGNYITAAELTDTQVKALGRSDADAGAYKYRMSNEANVIPGNAAFIFQIRKNATADSNGITEVGTLRCGTYNVKSGRTDSLSDQLPTLSQAEITDLLNGVKDACENLVLLANSVDKGKSKRDRLKVAINRAADRADKAEADESKKLTIARKLGQAMVTQVDNPANDFQSKAVQACSAVLSYVKKSLAEYK